MIDVCGEQVEELEGWTLPEYSPEDPCEDDCARDNP